MNRKLLVCKLLVWILAPFLLATLYGCPKKKPATPEETLDVQTETVAPETSATDIEAPVAPTADDQVEDPLLSSDLQVINDELRRRGFSADIYFNYDEASLSDDARDKLSRNADLLRGQPQFTMTIEGHCDERGTNEYNLALGDKRANATRDYLASLGVSGDRMRTISYGEERPACTQNDESCWSQNRRAHMVITGRANVG